MVGVSRESSGYRDINEQRNIGMHLNHRDTKTYQVI